MTWARLLSEHPGAWFGPYSPSPGFGGASSARFALPLQAVTHRPKVAPTKRMSKFLKHFTVVGDDYHTWNVNYKKWENEEEEEPAPTSAEGEGSAAGPDAEAGSVSAPRPALDFRTRLRKLFSSHRFQVRE